MTSTDDPPQHGLLGRTVAAVVFDWDGTAVPDRATPALAVRRRVEQLSALGVHLAVVSGTHLDNVDGQLGARPAGPGRLLLALNRGSELFEVGPDGPVLVQRTTEDPEARRLLDATAYELAERLDRAGIETRVVVDRLNRAKVDLIPLPQWRNPLKSDVERLLEAVTRRLQRAGIGSLADVVALAREVSLAHGLSDPRITSDGKHVEVGVTDKGDSVRDVLGQLERLGVAGDLVLVAGDELGALGGVPGSDAHLLQHAGPVGPLAVSVGVEPDGVPPGVRHLGGGPATLLALLDEQLQRARDLRVPEVSRDPRWTWTEHGPDAARLRVAESLFTLAAGGIGWRGSTEETEARGQPLVTAAGIYSGRSVGDGLLEGPDLVDLRLREPVVRDRRTLDLRTGVLAREELGAGAPLRSLRFASLVEPGLFALRVEAASSRMVSASRTVDEARSWSHVDADVGGIGAMTAERTAEQGGLLALQRLMAVDAAVDRPACEPAAAYRLDRASATGFEQLLSGQRAAWATRWDAVNVRIPDDPWAELRLRFALYHLWNLSLESEELAVGARSITGTGYSGHVFWDADAFVLPAMVTIDPSTAAAMVRYRMHRLDAARQRASSLGLAGARFPWESARDGSDVTPTEGFLGGEPVTIRTGRLEEHITADVAWAVAHNAAWTRPDAALTPGERSLVRETARYWASRTSTSPDGRAHILGVIGPDEYHEAVDDDAFTNVMARWNLRYAAGHARGTRAERAAWLRLAAALVDGYDDRSGRYEQFRGFDQLTPTTIDEVARPPVAADVLLGHRRVAETQVIKQPDALMIHYLVPEEAAAGSLAPCLDFYGPRTAHGSSLSPAIMSFLHARGGQADRALELLRMALSVDLEDEAGTTSGGVHIAAAAGAWRAVVGGFLGAAVHDARLHLDPILPPSWTELEVRFRCLGADVSVRARPGCVHVETSQPLVVHVAPTAGRSVTSAGQAVLEHGDRP